MQKLRKMDLTGVSIGSKRSQDKKMEASKVRSGPGPTDTLVTGETTARRALVSNSTRTETSTRACGPWTRNMVRVPTGGMSRAS